MILAGELVASGGPSAPVWAFLTAISIGILGIIGQQISAKKAANEAKIAAAKAAENSDQAQQNTANLANGFAGSVGNKLDRIIKTQDVTGGKLDELSTAFREHLEWHLKKDS